MKIDIEGTELEVLPDLLLSGALSQVDTIYMEWHERFTTDKNRKFQMIKVYW